MSFNQRLTKVQFKIDHASFRERVILLCGLLAIIMTPWYFLAYTPQVQSAAEIQQQITNLNIQTALLRAKYEKILNLAKSHDLDKLMAQYNQLKQEIKHINQQITQYHHTYINDSDIAQLLHSILNDIKKVSIEDFSTTVATVAPTEPAKLAFSPDKPATSTAPAASVAPVPPVVPTQPPPEMTHYKLSLKGDYFSIVQFLQRIEQLKWQLFWNTLHYKVDKYPQGIATIEFYTLKPPRPPVTPINEVAK